MHTHASGRGIPSRWQALVFHAKTRVFQLRRGIAEFASRPPWHAIGSSLSDAPVIAEKRTLLWNKVTAEEFPLTAGKVENLRIASRSFHGVEVPAGAVLSFWRQLGRTSPSKGYEVGRELREGCIVPAVGGGLCQLSGLLYQAALDAGMEIVERHAHSRTIPGSAAEQNLDATVFWNYVDLRFRGNDKIRIEVELTASELVVRFRSAAGTKPAVPRVEVPVSPRSAPSGDCLTCGMVACFRHPAAITAHAPALGHSAFLLDARWPEFDRWCGEHSRLDDRWFTPLDGRKWKKANYQWAPPKGVTVRHATAITLQRSLKQRRLPAQGRIRQHALLEGEAALAKRYAAMLDPQCRHVVVSQNLLPHLWKTGALGGRSFDVLIERWPMEELQRRLDLAKAAHPQSTTLGDFRAEPDLVRAEREALAAAARLVTPHRALARHFGHRAWLLDWEMPAALPRRVSMEPVLFFPASRLGRKGAFELAAALRGGVSASVKYLGRADEGNANPFFGLTCSQGSLADLASASALVIPAWIEHQPRLALLALASGVPVIATEACGLPEHELLHEIPTPDSASLADAILAVLKPEESACVA